MTNQMKLELDSKRNDLNDLLDKKVNGILLRSKANLVEHNEKNSKYFSNLEKKRAESKIITKLNINGTITSNQKTIRNEQRRFYESLYTKRNTSETTTNFFDNNVNKLNDTDQSSCEGKLSEYECGIALKQMKNNKSPGSDGITTEFYKIFWQDIKKYLVNSLNYSFENKSLTDLQKQGLITLLPKTDKDISLLSNWRPISLLNVDYKIATKSIANRIKQVLQKIISSSQTGFIKGRYIGENIRLICEILEHVEQNDLPSLMFFSDFEKAFDSIDHDFMYRTLRHFNFGNDLLRWTKLFYTDVQSCILNNGHMTEFFNIGRGVRQGCPLSPYLFIICIELLSLSICNNTDIKGININNNEVKNTLFADDATFIIDGSKKSFETLISTLDNFSCISGLRLNTAKCNVLRTGSLKNTEILYMNKRKFTWSSQKAKALGITFNTNNECFIKDNIDKKIEEFNNVLKQWQHRKLSLLGKITVIKSIALPKLIYPLTILQIPSADKIKQITSSMFKFIWNSKPEKIKRKHITQSYQKGGLKMIDIELFINSIKCSWIKRLFDDSNNGQWKTFYLDKINRYGGKLLFESNLNKGLITHMFPNNSFLREILIAWDKITHTHKEDIKVVGKQIIWNNRDIQINNQTLLYKHWLNKGIKHIEHIYDYRTKEFYTFTKIIELYNVSRNDYLKYNQLITAIPKEWKVRLKTEDIITNQDQTLLSKLLKCVQVNKLLYNFQLKKQEIPEFTQHNKWKLDLNKNEINWKQIYNNTFIQTIDSNLRNFQYKFLMRIIPTNDVLLKYKIKSSNLCDFCNMNVETNKHLFWECIHAQHFWVEIANLFRTYNIELRINYEIISFGLIEHIQLPHTKAKNFIILCAKYFIFLNKCRNTIPSIVNFKSYLFKQIDVEKQIAQEHEKIESHDIKWSFLT